MSIDIVIPRAQLFHFENYWVQQLGFFDHVNEGWARPTRATAPSHVLNEKIKALRVDLKKWKMGLSKLKLLISKCN